MEKACLISPDSEEKLWSKLRNRVESIVADLKTNSKVDASAYQSVEVASERGKRLREDSMLLLKGLDSVSSTLSQLSDTLNSAQKGVDALANSIQDEEPRAKRHCTSPKLTEKITLNDDAMPPTENMSDEKEENLISEGAAKSSSLKRARTLAVSMATKAASLSKELKSIKSELNFMQERCNLLEEENRRLREEDYERGASHDDEDLLRLQLEALLAEKSRLAQENANLTRENQSLHQLVEYHQLTSQDLTASFEEIEALYLDFSTPVGKEIEDGKIPVTPIDWEHSGSSLRN
ncbi:heat-inducible transcription repressor [Rhynchospora pubera]|uniref:Heat-inducible transcription repressor n=1 Tax=Rhynchospora pubera TaxID=906938 RepID=A0AAV8CUW3_9POAL|nr:heat-inducible transcription repressor [Rhynchospora pubera]